jgi:hypothetical protein
MAVAAVRCVSERRSKKEFHADASRGTRNTRIRLVQFVGDDSAWLELSPRALLLRIVAKDD